MIRQRLPQQLCGAALEELNEIIENKTFALPIAEHFKTIIKNALYKILK